MDVLIRGFLLDRASSGATQKTIKWHTTALTKFQSFINESDYSTNPNEWNATTLREFVVWLQTQPSMKSGEPISATSVRTYCNSVWAFCKWLFQEEAIEIDIAARAKKPRTPIVQKSAFTNGDLKHMLDSCKRSLNSHRDVAIISLLLDSGLRASEVCNLTIGDFHGNEHLLMIREGKGRKDRVVPISVKSALAISKYLNRVRGALRNDDPIFVNQRGGKMTPNALLQMVYRISNEAGVEDAHPHRFRHTFALHFLRNGGDPLTLQRILGHTTLEMTNRYVAMLTDDLTIGHAKASPLTNLK